MTSTIEKKLATVMKKEPQLNHFGIGVFAERRKTPAEAAEELKKNRERLRQCISDIEWTVEWLKTNIVPIQTISRNRTSYGLKHIAEKFSPNKYLSNGVFITAAIIAGYPYRTHPGSPNVSFGMSERSIKRLQKEIRGVSYE